jgi:hypothetical protein
MESDSTTSAGSAYTRKVENEGGINKVSIGMGTSIKNTILLGISLNYNFGRVEDDWNVTFLSGLYTDTADKISSTVSGTNIDLGIMAFITQNFLVGAVYNQQVKLSVESEVDPTIASTIDPIEYKLKIPHSWGIGASYITKNRFRLSSDLMFRPYSNMKIDDVQMKNAGDGYFIAAGVEKLSSPKLNASYLGKITYRLGFNFNQLNYRDADDNAIHEYMGILGMGLPYYGGRGVLNVAIGYGKRGNLDKNPFEENTIKLMITVCGGEKWFRRPKK